MSIFDERTITPNLPIVQKSYELHHNVSSIKFENFQKNNIESQSLQVYKNIVTLKPTIGSANFNEIKRISGMTILDLLSSNKDIIQSIATNGKLYLLNDSNIFTINLHTMLLENTQTSSDFIKIAANGFQHGNVGANNNILYVSTGFTYPTTLQTTNTTNVGHLDVSNFLSISGFVFNQVLPSNTSIKYLISVNDRTSWLYWNGTGWMETTDIETDGMSETFMESLSEDALKELTGIAVGNIDFMIGLKTIDYTTSPKIYNINIKYLPIPKYQSSKQIEYKATTSKFIGRWLGLVSDTEIPLNTSVSYEYSYSSNGTIWTDYVPLNNDSDLRNIVVHGSKSGYSDQLKIRVTLSTTEQSSTPKIYELRVKYSPIDIVQELEYPTNVEGYNACAVFKIPKTITENGTLQFRIAISRNSDMSSPTYYDSYSTGAYYNPNITWHYSDNYNQMYDPNDETLTNWISLGTSIPSSKGIVGVNGAPVSTDSKDYYLRVILPSSWTEKIYANLLAWNGVTEEYLETNFRIFDEFTTTQNYLRFGDGAKTLDYYLSNSEKLTILDSNITNSKKLTASITTDSDFISILTYPYLYKEITGDFAVEISTNKSEYSNEFICGLKICDYYNPENFMYAFSSDENSHSYSYINNIEANTSSVLGNFSYIRLSKSGDIFTFSGKQNLQDSITTIGSFTRTDINNRMIVGIFFGAPNYTTRNYKISYFKEV